MMVIPVLRSIQFNHEERPSLDKPNKVCDQGRELFLNIYQPQQSSLFESFSFFSSLDSICSIVV